MIEVQLRTYNPFQENSYLLINEKKECIIIDPGCYFKEEQQDWLGLIRDQKLHPIRLWNTHTHIDHIFGNSLMAREFGLGLEIHELDLPLLALAPQGGLLYQLPFEDSPPPQAFLNQGDRIPFGEQTLEIILTPGHSPGSISIYAPGSGFLIAGDVLFRGSIGRTDLPGGNHEVLLESIRSRLIPLGDSIRVYPGHGPETTLGEERIHNPFLV